jgi:hypothetical protein
MTQEFWGYFVSRKELIDIYLDAGGELHSVPQTSVEASNIARRSVVDYLMPGRVRVYLDIMEVNGSQACGITFMIDPNNIGLDEIPKGLLERCDDMFLREPDHFIRQMKPEWKGFRIYACERRGKFIGTLESLNFLEYVISLCSAVRFGLSKFSRSDKKRDYSSY